MAGSGRSRKWVVRAMISFVAILALLTFFSNTIMNMTIPKVMGAYAVRGNLSSTNSSTGLIEADDKTNINSIAGRTVDKVEVSYLDYVYAGDVLYTLKEVEDQSSLEELQDQLTELTRARDYAARTPAETTDYVTLQEAINTAQNTLDTARDTLEAAQNKDETIAAANSIISENSTLAITLAAEVQSASDTVESLSAEISRLESEITTREQEIDILVDLGVPTPTPTPVPGINSAAPVQKRADGDADTGSDTTDPSDTSETTPTTETTSDPTANPSTDRIGELQEEIAEREEQIEELEEQLEDAQDRLNSASSSLADVNAAIAEAQAALEAADALPSVSSAQSAVNLAQAGVSSAVTTYNNTQITDAIAADKAADEQNDRIEDIADLEEKIEKLEEKMSITEVVAPTSGYVYNITIQDGDIMEDDKTVVMYIVPDTSTYSVTFKFDTKVAQDMSIGQSLTIDKYWVDDCIITNIKPDAENPREKREVKCAIQSMWAWPGESLTATADKSNADYEHVIASSAIIEDNGGTFVYVIEESTSPLGDKYVVKRVKVDIEGTDGALTAISGEGIAGNLIVVRSEEPLQDGDRVRLEDYGNNS
ncbi:MAG: hypothetical protein IKT14_06330 [Clostridiales bacterium]|nr:hypothetical protein [Clostridiales bacterium]